LNIDVCGTTACFAARCKMFRKLDDHEEINSVWGTLI
jgi:hypothetical protein